MNRRFFYYIICPLCCLFCMAIQSCDVSTEIDRNRIIKIALREAGNQLLLKNKDSTSLILPIIQKGSDRFELSFQNQLSFEPDMLVQSIDSSFSIVGLSKNYRVEVLQCKDGEVAYSYEMNAEIERTLIPCSGRFLPMACYTIELSFLDQEQGKTNTIVYYMLLVVLIIILALVYHRKRKQSNSKINSADEVFESIGSFQFYPEQNKLVKAATEISLSRKECELLEIFVANINQVVKRDELTKRVWEDNGVIVGRSLDTYISKLRKKLKSDVRIQITNIHGVGYKLEIL